MNVIPLIYATQSRRIKKVKKTEIEQIINEWGLTKEDLQVIQREMHDEAVSLLDLRGENYGDAYAQMFEDYVRRYKKK